MYRMLFSMMLLVILLIPQVAWAGTPAAKTKPSIPTAVAGLSVNKPGNSSKIELTNIRYYTHVDATTGESKLRLVIESAAPVKADSVVTSSPTPRINIDIKGTSITKLTDIDLDGKIADKVSFSKIGDDTSRITVQLPAIIGECDYKIFTLASDPKADKPFRVVVDINKPSSQPTFSFTPGLKNKIIVIDPGHGGSDSGAIGPGNVQEKTVTFAVAQKVQVLLEKAGAKVLMTRTDDSDVFGPNASAVDELQARSAVGNNNRADIFVSIHINAFTSSAAVGTETYYYKKTIYDVMLAQNIQNSLAVSGGLQDRGINSAGFYVLKRTLMPAVLTELGFISNPNEERLLSTPQFQQQMALGITQGLENFFAQAAAQQGGGL